MVLAASSASAQSAASEKAQAFEDASGWSIAGLLGFGSGGYNEFGLGARFGYTLPSHVYLGGSFIDYPGLANYYGNTFVTGFEGGYNIKAGPLVVRPYGGIGLLDISYAIPAVCGNGFACTSTASATFFAFWAGGTALFPVSENWFVGGDLRFLITGVNADYGGSSFSVGLMGTGGYQF